MFQIVFRSLLHHKEPRSSKVYKTKDEAWVKFEQCITKLSALNRATGSPVMALLYIHKDGKWEEYSLFSKGVSIPDSLKKAILK